MNERIKELAAQAQKVVGYTDGGYTEIKQLDQEQFAKLIAMDILRDVEWYRGGDIDDPIAYIRYKVAKRYGLTYFAEFTK